MSLREVGHFAGGQEVQAPPSAKGGTKRKTTRMGGFLLVAGRGLEPPDLRVMSPTSYQLLYPAIYDVERELVPETGLEPVRYFRITGF